MTVAGLAQTVPSFVPLIRDIDRRRVRGQPPAACTKGSWIAPADPPLGWHRLQGQLRSLGKDPQRNRKPVISSETSTAALASSH